MTRLHGRSMSCALPAVAGGDAAGEHATLARRRARPGVQLLARRDEVLLRRVMVTTAVPAPTPSLIDVRVVAAEPVEVVLRAGFCAGIPPLV